MKRFFSEDMLLETKLSSNEIYEILKNNVDKVQDNTFFHNRKSDKPYEGNIRKDAFGIREIIKGKNSFRPVIYGFYSSKENGTTLKIKIRIEISVFIFLCIFLGLFFFFFISGIFMMIKQKDIDFFPFAITGLILLSFGILWPIASFDSDRIKIKRELKTIFKAYEINSD